MARLKIWDAGSNQWQYVDCTGSGITDLDGLSDVVIDNPQNNQHLVYLAASGQWYNYTVTAGATSPGGSDSFVQYNDNGLFGGDPNFRFIDSNNLLMLTDGALLLSGTVGSTPASGAGTRLMWVPDLSAFRAGQVAGTEWDIGNIGISSLAIGKNNRASGWKSISLGGGNISEDETSVSIGEGNYTGATFGVAIGSLNSATRGLDANVVGNDSEVSGIQAKAYASFSSAMAEDAMVLGYYLTASATGASVIGRGISPAQRMINTTGNSLMIGYNSTVPTVMVTTASGTGTRGRVGIGVTAPTARLHLMAGSTTATTAPLMFTSGALLTLPENGAMEYDGAYFYVTPFGIRRRLLTDVASGIIDFGGATSFEIPNGTGPVVDAAGEIAIDTDAYGDLVDQGLIIYHDGVRKMYVPAVDTLPSVSGVVLTYDSVNDRFFFGPQSASNPSVSLDDLTDVTITGLQNRQILQYIAASGQWYNVPYCASSLPICLPTDGSWTDGINAWTSGTTTADALDDLNETLSYLAPADAGPLAGALTTSNLTGGPYTGRISRGNANYKVSEGADGGSSISYIIASTAAGFDDIFTLTNSNTSTTFNKADEGFTRWYRAVGTGAYSLQHSVNHSTLFSEGSRNGSQTITDAWRTNQLKVTSVGWYGSPSPFPKWQKGNATIDISGSLLSSGYNKVKMSREGSFVTQESSDYEIFYDDSNTTMVASAPVVTEATKVSGQLSGVSHYVRTSTFNVSGQITNVFRNTYLDPPVQLVASPGTGDLWIATTNLSVFPTATDGAYLGVSSPPFLTENARFNNKVVTVSSSNVRNTDGRITAQSTHPFRSVVSTSSASQGRLINGYLNNAAGTASDTAEPFDNEWFRLLSNFNIDSTSYSAGATGGWNSNIYLTSATAGYSDGLQIYNGGLKYPNQNYTSGFLPTTGQPNYSGASGTRVYIRYYYVGAGRQNFTWTFTNVSGTTTFVTVGTALTGNNVTFEMLAPATTKNGGGTTVWKDCMTAYTTDTAAGCYTSGSQTSTSSNWVTTLGTKSTSTSGNVICIRLSAGSSWGGVLGSLNVSAS